MRQFYKIVLILFTGLISVTENTQAQWTPVMPSGGGSVYGITSIGPLLFAARFGNASAYMSADSGMTWTMTGNMGDAAFCITSKGTDLFAGTAYGGPGLGGGVIRSQDGGINWDPSTPGGVVNTVFAIAADSNYVYAAFHYDGIFRSANNGNSWTDINNGLPLPCCQSRALLVSDSGLFVTVLSHGIFRSMNNGTLWTPVNNGLTNLLVYCLTQSGNNLYAGTINGGVFMTSDYGNSWINISNGLPSVDISCIAANGSDIFIGTDAGVYHSGNNGQAWGSMNNGLAHLDVYHLRLEGSTLLAGHALGIDAYQNALCPASYNSIATSACGSYTSPSGNQTWTSSGLYSDTLTNSIGCDSILSVNLTILPIPIATLSASGPISFCQGDSVILTCAPSSLNYQWHRNNVPVIGGTAPTITVKYPGRYYCIASDGSCSDTSNTIRVRVPCIPIGPNEEKTISDNDELFLDLAPNPSSGLLTINSPAGKISIINSLGETVLTTNSETTVTELDLSAYPSGIYLVVWKQDDFVLYKKCMLY